MPLPMETPRPCRIFSSLDAIILPLITLEGGIIIAHCPQQKTALVLENSEGQEPLSCPSW